MTMAIRNGFSDLIWQLEALNGEILLETGRKEKAEQAFRRAASLRADDPPTALYLRRLSELGSSPPPKDWDGVTNLTQK